jgi:hypothetical protein
MARRIDGGGTRKGLPEVSGGPALAGISTSKVMPHSPAGRLGSPMVTQEKTDVR